MIVLDTDHVSILERIGPESQVLRERLASLSANEVATTIISYEEQTRGWMAYIAKANSLSRQVEAYRRLRMSLDNYRTMTVLDFSEHAAVEFQRLRHLRPRTGVMDLKIAAIALANGGRLLSRNLGDFRGIPGLIVENWAV